MNLVAKSGRVLDFDTENVPGFYWYDDKTTDFLHTVAWCWVDNPKLVEYLTTYWDPKRGLVMQDLGPFLAALSQADAVTGHNIKRHDIPLTNGHALRYGLKPIAWPAPLDTLQMFPKTGGISKSQENLAALYDLAEQKMRVPLPVWERASRGEPAASKIVVDRCISDVRGHAELYTKIREQRAA